MKKFFLLVLLILSLILTGCSKQQSSASTDRLSIVAATFPSYDAARAIVGDRAELYLLVPPGGDSHSYEPTIDDVMRINSSDLFIYTGGESDTWIVTLLSALDEDVNTFSLVEHVPLLLTESDENIVQGEDDHDHSHSLLDEHVWTSLENEIAIIESLADTLASLDGENAEYYHTNATAYANEIATLKDDFTELVESSERREIVVADRFPLLYFATEFGLEWHAAFPGCSSESEPSARTIATLIDLVKEEELPVVLRLTTGNSLFANTIADETGSRVLTLYAGETLSRYDFDRGMTYLDMLKANLETLGEALN